jgi:hypothetical protein
MALLETGALNPEHLAADVHRALATWDKLGSTEEELMASLLLVQDRRARQGEEISRLALRRITNELLAEAIERLAEQNEREAAVLRARFIDGQITRQVANRLYASPDQVNRWQRHAIEHLTDILLSQELTLRDERRDLLLDELPAPSYTRLFGFEDDQQELLGLLMDREGRWAAVISGIGGIGKTSVADAVARRAAESFRFERLLWYRAVDRDLGGRPMAAESVYEAFMLATAERLWPESAPGEATSTLVARVRQTLKSRPFLVIIDNLETRQTTAYFLERAAELTNPSKCLLTTRSRPTVTADAFMITLDELSEADAVALLRHQARAIGLADMSETGDEALQAIYRVTGGNPLALKLVVSLAAVLPLTDILADMARTATTAIEEMYRHIYWHAWRSLSPDGQKLLQAMPLVGEQGALPQQMQAMSSLSDESFWPAVTELISRSLIEAEGTMFERRYGIHRLTESFLRTQIINWPGPAGPDGDRV